MGTNVNAFDWETFWKSFSEEPEEIKDIEGLVFKNKSGTWVANFLVPNSKDIVSCAIDYDPWTGNKLK